jgi:uncharacterized lipoprotein YddW (UPF0748 family)
MPARKLAITIGSDVHARVVRAAHKRKMSISAWLTEAARRSLRIGDGLAAVEEWEREHGALSDEELKAARQRVRSMHLTPQRGRRHSR